MKVYFDIIGGNVGAVAAQLKSGAQPVLSGGWSVLHVACMSQCDDMVQMMLDRGLSVEVIDDMNARPLHFACFNGRKNMVDMLLGGGAEPNVANSKGHTPLMLLAGQKAGGGLTWDNKGDVVRALLAAGADLNARDEAGNTALHYAAKQGNEALFFALLEAGAERGAENNAGMGVIDLCPNEEAKQRFGSRLLAESVSKAFDSAAGDDAPATRPRRASSGFSL